jgi:transcriptional regulator with XRE-family HTH domain
MADRNLVILGNRVRELRQGRGLSQELLADMAQVHRNYVGLIERGERNMGVGYLIALARAMEVTPAAFFENLAFDATPPTSARKKRSS